MNELIIFFLIITGTMILISLVLWIIYLLDGIENPFKEWKKNKHFEKGMISKKQLGEMHYNE